MKGSRIVSGVLVLILLFGSFAQPVLASVKDVPPDHWAYQAVVSLVNRGFLSTYEDGSFQGNNPVDRYTLATTVARILDEIEAGRIIGSQSDADLLRELTIEFRAELVQFYADKQRMETLLTDTQKQVVATEERLNNVVAGQVQLSDEVAKLKADLMQEANKTTESLNQFQTLIQEQRASLQALKEQVHAQQSSIESHQSQLAAHGGQVTTQEDRLIELQNAIVKIDQNLLQQQTDIDRIWNWIAEKELVFSMLVLDQEFQDSIKELSDAIAGLDQEHQLDLEQLQTKIDSLTDTIAKADGEIIRAQEQLKIQLDNLSKRNQEIESDIQNLSMMLKQEYGPMITELEAQVERLATQVGISEEELANLNKTISDEIAVQMNAALIRERSLSSTVAELQAQFDSYKQVTDKELKSAKSTAMIAVAAAVISVVIGFIK
ncbi:MAG: hypothetical protein GX228_00590 [Firmicutes bacterium]|jgi:chromosome segregation ATPase|nr:S-layer homology domain-containing protein [Bacillota bacterium]NLL87414.1 hypothetical protein [Bacillota bacterium]HKM18345.1 S-layer homology domain-containing protein [Limnochordia bacterium]